MQTGKNILKSAESSCHSCAQDSKNKMGSYHEQN